MHRRDTGERRVPFRVQNLQRLAPKIFRWFVTIGLPVATASGQIQALHDLPQTKAPVTLLASSDPVTSKSEFRFQDGNTPPVIRVRPGSVLNVEYKNELDA